MTALASREIKWITEFAKPNKKGVSSPMEQRQNDPGEHIRLLEKYLTLVPYFLPQGGEIAKAFLYHTDLHLGNIFVDRKGHVTSIIDWQSAWGGPLITEARHPSFIKYGGEIMLRLPEDYESLDAEGQEQAEDTVTNSVLLYFYEALLAQKVPLLHEVFHFPDLTTRCYPLQFVEDTWDGELLPFRESLLKVVRSVSVHKPNFLFSKGALDCTQSLYADQCRNWNKIGGGTPCPISFSDQEIRNHLVDGEHWNDMQDFWDSLAGVIGRDGWTSHESYEQAKNLWDNLLTDKLDNVEEAEVIQAEQFKA